MMAPSPRIANAAPRGGRQAGDRYHIQPHEGLDGVGVVGDQARRGDHAGAVDQDRDIARRQARFDLEQAAPVGQVRDEHLDLHAVGPRETPDEGPQAGAVTRHRHHISRGRRSAQRRAPRRRTTRR
jgi:hypothetical protein